MKTVPTFFLLPAIAVGFALAWVIKQAPETTVAQHSDSTAPNDGSDSSPKISDRSSETHDSHREHRTSVVFDDASESKVNEAQEAAMEKYSKQMQERMLKADQKLIEEFTAMMGLTPGQVAKLEKYFNDRRIAMSGNFQDLTDSTKMKELMDTMKPEHFESLMSEILTPEQAELYAEHKTKERNKQVESAALVKLAAFSKDVDIRPDQRDAVYDVLYADAGVQVDKLAESGQTSMMDSYGGGFDTSLYMHSQDLFDFSDTENMMDIYSDAENDPKNVREKLKEMMDKRIDQKVSQFSGVLDQDQLDQYRSSMESKASAYLSMMSLGE